MKKNKKIIFTSLLAIALVSFIALPAYAAQGGDAASSLVGNKAIASAIAIALPAACGAIGMGMAISKSSEAISRQPESEDKLRTNLMLGLVFIETAIIYGLIIAILIIFVL